METIMFLISCIILIIAVIVVLVGVLMQRHVNHRSKPCTLKKVSNLDTEYAGMDLSGKPRATYRLTLPDGEILFLRTPTKAVADSFERIGVILQHIAYGNCKESEKNELYRISSVILSHNTGGRIINAKEVLDLVTMADLAELLQSYMEWLTAVISSKN